MITPPLFPPRGHGITVHRLARVLLQGIAAAGLCLVLSCLTERSGSRWAQTVRHRDFETQVDNLLLESSTRLSALWPMVRGELEGPWSQVLATADSDITAARSGGDVGEVGRAIRRREGLICSMARGRTVCLRALEEGGQRRTGVEHEP